MPARPYLAYAAVDERYFRTMGLSVVRGLDFTRDDRAGAPNPIGHRIAESGNRPRQARASMEIVGVVPDGVSRLRDLEPMILYQPLAQRAEGPPNRTIRLRAAGDPEPAVDPRPRSSRRSSGASSHTIG